MWTEVELANGVPALHPERKGQLNRSPKKNWVEKRGGLPTYINSWATALKRENPSWPISRCIAVAISMMRKTLATGRAVNLKGKPKVSAAVKAAIKAALAKWEAMKMKASETGEEVADSLNLSETDRREIPVSIFLAQGNKDLLGQAKSDFDEFVKRAEEFEEEDRKRRVIREAARRLMDAYTHFSEEVPGEVSASATLSDEEYVEQLTGEGAEAGEFSELDGDEAEAFMSQLEELAMDEVGFIMPESHDKAMKLSAAGKLWKKEILRAGTINYHGQKFSVTPEQLKQACANFKAGALDYVPLQFSGDNNEHTDASDKYAGKIEELQVSKDGKSLIGIFSLTPEAERIVKHNPKFGVSVFWHSAYKRMSDSKFFGPAVLHVAAVHRPVLNGMSAWEAMLSEDTPEGIAAYINLSEAEYETEKEVGKLSDNDNRERTEGVETVTLSQDEITSMLDAKLSEARANWEAEAKAQFEALKQEAHDERVANLSESYKDAGVPPYIVDTLAPLLSAHRPDEDKAFKLSEGDTEVEVNTYEALTKALSALEGTVDLSEERGSQEDDAGDDIPADIDAGADFLLGS